MKKLYRLNADCGRMGYVQGLFTAEEEKVKNLLGRIVNFGEILGKHSDVSIKIEDSELEVLTEDQDFIKQFDKLGCSSGYNPFDYIEDEA